MSWFDTVVELLYEDPWVHCEGGHTTHARHSLPVEGEEREMWAYDYEAYRDTVGYCPGDDDVSRTIELYGRWEPGETEVFKQVLFRTSGAVIDFGSHIGWYTRLGLLHEREVLAIEACPENAEMTLLNARAVYRADHLHQALHWVDAGTPQLPAEGAPPIAIVKIDIEGEEDEAIRALALLLDAGNIAYILMEVSPVFNTSYPALVRLLMEHYGFGAARVRPWRAFGIEEIDDAVGEFPQVDMVFGRNPWWLL